MKIVHFTGLRLGAAYPDWPEAGERIRKLSGELLVKVFQTAADMNVSTLLCTGDLFDSNAVSLADVNSVLDVCRRFPRQTLVVLPGGRDPWAPYCAHRHLGGHRTANLVVLFPESACPTALAPGLWIYGIPEDVAQTQSHSLRQLERRADDGWHIAVAYGNRGRLQPGPEEGLVMAPPEVMHHPFDYLALADGGPAERVGTSARPACYAAPMVAVEPVAGLQAGASWLVNLSGTEPAIEAIQLEGISRRAIELDVTRLPGMPAIAQAIRREAGAGMLFDIRLVGTRTASSPVLEPELAAYCADDLLGFRIQDDTRLTAPDDLATSPSLLRALWLTYSESSDTQRGPLRDAIKLAAAGKTNPAQWRQAPWARSS
jgi:hypothetical protein